MYTKEELIVIRAALPKNGYNLVAEKLPGKTPDAVRMVLTYPNRYQEEVFAAVTKVIEESRAVTSVIEDRKATAVSSKKRLMNAIK